MSDPSFYFKWVTNPNVPLNKYILSMLDGQGSEDTLITPYYVELDHPFQKHSLKVLQRNVIIQGHLTSYEYKVQAPQKILDTINRYTQQVCYVPLSIQYEPPDASKAIYSRDMSNFLQILRSLLREYIHSAPTPFKSNVIHKIIADRYEFPIYYSFYPLYLSTRSNIDMNDIDDIENYHRLLPMGIGTIQNKLASPPVENASEFIQSIYVDEDTLRDIQSHFTPKLLQRIVNKVLISDLDLAKHVLSEWSKAHDYNMDTLLSSLTFVGKTQSILLIDYDVIGNTHENIFEDISMRASKKHENGWFVYKIPFTRTALNPKGLVQEVAKSYKLEILKTQDEGVALTKGLGTSGSVGNEVSVEVEDIPGIQSEIVLRASDAQRRWMGVSPIIWLDQTIASIYADNTNLKSELTFGGEWNRLSNIYLSNRSYPFVWFALFQSIQTLASQGSLSLLGLEPKDIYVFPDLSIRISTWDPSIVKDIQTEVQRTLQNPDNIHVDYTQSEQDAISIGRLTNINFPNTNAYNFNLEDLYVIVTNAPIVVPIKRPEDRIPSEDIKQKGDWEKIGIDWRNIQKIEKNKDLSQYQVFYPIVRILSDKLYVSIRSSINNNQYDLLIMEVSPFDKDPTAIIKLERIIRKMWNKGMFLTNYGYNSFKRNPNKFQESYIKPLYENISNFNELKQYYNSQIA